MGMKRDNREIAEQQDYREAKCQRRRNRPALACRQRHERSHANVGPERTKPVKTQPATHLDRPQRTESQ